MSCFSRLSIAILLLLGQVFSHLKLVMKVINKIFKTTPVVISSPHMQSLLNAINNLNSSTLQSIRSWSKTSIILPWVASILLTLCSLVLLLLKYLVRWVCKIGKRVWSINLNPCYNTPACKVLRKIPGPKSYPVIGASWLYSRFGPYTMEKYHEANDDKLKIYGEVCREEVLFNFPLIHLFAAKDIEQVLRHPSRYPLRPPNEADVFYRQYRPQYYNNIGMVNENGPNWHFLRTHLTPPLSSTRTLRHYAGHMDAIGQDLVDLVNLVKSSAGHVDNFKDLIYRTGLEAVCMVALERRMGFLENSLSFNTKSIVDAIHGYQKSSCDAMYGLPFWKYLPVKLSGCINNLMKCKDFLFTTFSALVEETIAINKMDGGQEDSILSTLLSVDKVAVKDVKASVVDYITAGMDTIGNSMIFLIACIANDPSVQEKLHEEIDRVLPNKSNITPESLREMTYLKACVMESFRMYPTASQIARITEREFTLSTGHILPPYSVVLCHHRIACLQEENFTNAKKFLPERWLPGLAPANHNINLVLPFGSGKRMCPGKRLAEQEIYTLAAKLFQNFTLQLSEPLQMEFNFLLTPAGPFGLNFLLRE